MNDVFTKKGLEPMLLHESKPFNDPDYIFELKLDGIRCLAYLSNETSLRNKRDKELIDIYPELKSLHKRVKDKCILDGELVCMVEGKPDFYSLQKRAMLSDKLKIKLASKFTPVQFVAYDIIYLKDKLICDLLLLERKKILEKTVKECDFMSISRYFEEKGVNFFEIAKNQGLEGIVAKVKDSTYQLGKRSYDWLKIKALNDDDFYICGVKLKDDGTIKDILLCTKIGKGYKYNGSVAMGISKTDARVILEYVKKNPDKPLVDKADAIFCKPKLVCTVRYMEKTKSGSLRQPVFKGLRDDKVWK
ncbi:MAG: ATP-dependent DNA ligase [Clostridia bacterium]|nr:ATP-dependent DNA ligase [Clostridia bacterium]